MILASALPEIERAFHWPFFDVARGGDPRLWQHLFWLFGHPEVYVIFQPAGGVLSTLIPVLCFTTTLGYGPIVASIPAPGTGRDRQPRRWCPTRAARGCCPARRGAGASCSSLA